MNAQSRNSVWEQLQFIGPRYLIMIVLLGLALRMMLFMVFHPWTPRIEIEYVLTGDALGYHELAAHV
jgi:hypothetical protein